MSSSGSWSSSYSSSRSSADCSSMVPKSWAVFLAFMCPAVLFISACGGKPKVTPACVPECSGKQCGQDGCGGTCGTCAGIRTCSGSGQCQACAPGTGQHCMCPSGIESSQTCMSDGSGFGPCSPCPSPTCTPGQSMSCTCPNEASGTQTCLAGGAGFGQCSCGASQACSPGGSRACTCTSGGQGTQSCMPDGSGFGACSGCSTASGGGNWYCAESGGNPMNCSCVDSVDDGVRCGSYSCCVAWTYASHHYCSCWSYSGGSCSQYISSTRQNSPDATQVASCPSLP